MNTTDMKKVPAVLPHNEDLNDHKGKRPMTPTVSMTPAKYANRTTTTDRGTGTTPVIARDHQGRVSLAILAECPSWCSQLHEELIDPDDCGVTHTRIFGTGNSVVEVAQLVSWEHENGHVSDIHTDEPSLWIDPCWTQVALTVDQAANLTQLLREAEPWLGTARAEHQHTK
ncbi:hypothetical protein MHY20_00075 [Helcobacillus sp. ACRRO]|uniref:hypothetical protein n=1 Tax=Helcobacillus sp. ACRRO TaxID=2918202 RepID=UPI001EF4F9DB|nr:hypothetical protein [Helcobacillus sp. ACRRO]MCG7426027.1 hypothetical protein [Helcobacillus sp. ACRRO]